MSDASASPSNPGNDAGEMTTANVVRLVGRVFAPLLGAVAIFGQHMILLGRAFTWLFRRPFRLRLYLEQMEFIGVGSMPIIMLVGFFTGAVTALQAITALAMAGKIAPRPSSPACATSSACARPTSPTSSPRSSTSRPASRRWRTKSWNGT